MKNIYKIVILFLAVFTAQTLFAGEKVKTFNLTNGIKVIYRHTDTSDITSLKFYSPVSVFFEQAEKAGVTSLMNSVMLKSTKNRDLQTLAADIENLGSSINSDVEYDFSGFTLNCMTENFEQSCAILADIILNPIFDEKEIKKEKDLTIQVIKSRQDSIGRTANDKFISDFFGSTNPYSRIKYGTVETVATLEKLDLENMYKKVFSSKGITITVVGSVKLNTLKKCLEKYFSSLKPVEEIPDLKFKNNVTRDGKDVVVDSKFNQAYIIYAYDAPDASSKDFATLKLINSILGGRMTGRLFVELREKLGLAYEVNSIYPTRKAGSYFEVYIGLDKKNIDVAKNGIEKIMKDICETKVGETELEDTKSFIKGVYLLDHQAVERQAYYLAFREMTGLGYQYDETYMKLLSEVTADDIISCANKYFKNIPYKLIMKSSK